MSLVGLIVAFIVVLVLVWAARQIMAATGTPEPIATVIYVVIVLLAVVWLLSAIGAFGAISYGPTLRLR